MALRQFIDTNILVYAADFGEPAKQEKAQAVLRDIRGRRTGVISTQVMQEFFSIATKKLGMSALDAKRLTLTLTEFEVVPMTSGLIESAMDLTILHQLSFWDASILAAARFAKCDVVFTEDAQSSKTIAGLRIENPLLSSSS